MTLEKQILLGTMNPAKVGIIQAALASLPIKVLTLSDLNLKIEVKEDGLSTEENAEKKARAYFSASHIPTLAIDGGLHIEKFPAEKQPETFVRRIYGADRDATDEELLDYYARELDKVGGTSTGIWRGAMALALSNEKVFFDTFTFRTILASKRKGRVIPGAPLNALTIDPTTGKYYSEMAWEEQPHGRWIFEFVKRHVEEL
jgi:inosine/xanthosine triphosphate pyrophosphatase family protein